MRPVCCCPQRWRVHGAELSDGDYADRVMEVIPGEDCLKLLADIEATGPNCIAPNIAQPDA